ncbi:MAG TPA: hypothetical protein PK588_10760 [Paludibacteraceae bacterium]|nr:hypothetical protein [Paludibacteraceae bacterium]
MEKQKKTINFYMRSIHRYLGYFMAGSALIFALSGIVLVFRDTDFLKQEKVIQKTISPNLSSEDLNSALNLKNFKVEKEENGTLYFSNQGKYEEKTGNVSYVISDVIFPLNKFISLHKAASKKSTFFWYTIFFGIALLALVVSSFWMFKPENPNFKKCMIFTVIGIVLSVAILFFV